MFDRKAYMKSYCKKYYADNQDKIKSNSKLYRENFKSKAKAAQQKWYKENPEYCKIYSRKWTKENPDKVKKAKANFKARNPDYQNIASRKFKYNLSPAEFKKMVRLQKNKCAICQSTFINTPHIDHCHSTRIIRGLLCKQCNTSLGHFKDSAKMLKAAIVYLKKGALNDKDLKGKKVRTCEKGRLIREVKSKSS